MPQNDRLPLRALLWRAAPLLPLATATVWLGLSTGNAYVILPLVLSAGLFAAALVKRMRPIDRISRLEEVNRSLAVIEFAPDCTILHANGTFLDLMGYSLDEVCGQKHQIFVAASERDTPAYADFWDRLRAGEFQRAEFMRIAKDGTPRWISASYNPIFNRSGRVIKVIKFATDVTRQHQLVVDNELVQFTLDSTASRVAVANDAHRITYLNDSMRNLLSELTTDLQSVIPGFSVGGIVGLESSRLHPKLTKETLAGASAHDPTLIDVDIGGRLIRMIITPVINQNGVRVGTVINMRDRTDEVATERELQGVVARANAGELNVRIEVEGKRGAMLSLSQGVNDLLDVCESVIEETMRVFGAMAQGDLSQTINSEYGGAFAQLKADANSTVARLVDVIQSIRAAIEPVRKGAQEIADGNINLSQRTEHQASSLERTAANLDALTGTVKRNAEHAQKANELAGAARAEAMKGGSVARDAVTAMSEINESSKRISDIVGVIDEIAFQTNLLALNAAVEAARAGEQGRGFAVVASEVRNLAGRSASSAKEIKNLIEDSERKVQQGSRLVHNSGEVLDGIVERVNSVSSIVGEIAAASQEQSDGINNVNTAISRMDEMTQQNSAMVQQAAAASKVVGAQAAKLAGLIEFFDADKDSALRVGGTVPAPGSAPSYSGPERRSARRPWSSAPSAKDSRRQG